MKQIELKSEILRDSFTAFFRGQDHKILPSSSLVPQDDVSVLLTTAGMQQFKKYFTGELDAQKELGTKNIATIQKCFRTSDIDEVGDDCHLTFFEMLGNFSFGGYYKREAIKYAFEYLTKILGLKIDYVTVFDGSENIPPDQESLAIWKDLGVPEEKIKFAGIKDNFWGPTGDFGPCGPTTEIYIEGIEVWNIVFNEFLCQGPREALEQKKAILKELPYKGIDTGMGLERLMFVLAKQRGLNIQSFYETDIFSNSLKILENISKKDYQSSKKHFHIIADHIRGAVFLINDGVLPSNLKAGYILRRILRRLIRSLMALNSYSGEILESLIIDIIQRYKITYPDLSKNKDKIIEVIKKEGANFSKALKRGLVNFNKLAATGAKIISGKEAFYLFQSYGLPLELIKEIAAERGIRIDENGFKAEFLKHQQLSKPKVA